jgi:phage-related tail fiber protein
MASVIRFDEWQDSDGNAVINGVNGFAGAVMAFARDTAPDGWIKANGANISRTTYSKLFDAIGTSFGVGDGSTTFTLPDMRGEFVRGWDDSRGIDFGRVFGSAQGDQMQGHQHTVVAASSGTGGPCGNCVPFYALNTTITSSDPVSDGVNGTPRSGAETRPRNLAMLYCIKY